MSDRGGEVGRSILLTALSYPLFVVGLVLLFVGPSFVGAVLTVCGTFLVGVNEICYVLRR